MGKRAKYKPRTSLNKIEKEVLNLSIEDRLRNLATVIVDRIVEPQQQGLSLREGSV